MTSRTRRAFHLSGASWLLLCAIGNSAMAEDAAAPPDATPLPEITVTAPSPIVRHRTVPSRTPARVARAAPGRNRERARQSRTGAGRGRAPTGRAAGRDRSVRNRHRRPNEEIRRSRCRDARRSPVFQTRHHRLQLCAGRIEPADHPRSRRQPRRHRRERHRRRRRLRPRRGSFRAHRPVLYQPGRSRARTCGAALRLDIDRRRRQRDQQPDSGCAAHLPRRAVQELRTAGQGAAGGCAIIILHECRDANGGELGRSRRRRRHLARCRRQQCRGSCRRLRPQDQRLQHPELSLSVRPDQAGQRPPAELRGAGGRRVGRRLLFLPGRLHRRSRSRRTTRSTAFPASTAPITRPGSTVIRPSSPPRANIIRMRTRSMP